MLYRNINTGEVRKFQCKIKSSTWELVETQTPMSLPEKEEKPVRRKKSKE